MQPFLKDPRTTCLIVALLLAGWPASVQAQSARGSLRVSGTIQASFHLEAKGEAYSSIGEGAAASDLRVTVYPGSVAVRVTKANSNSRTYSLVLRGGKEDLKLRDLPYDTTLTVVVPDSDSKVPLAMLAIPD